MQGGWARSDSIELAKWERYNPVIVQLAAHGFMEKHAEKASHWIDVPEGKAIKALIVNNKNEQRVYVVTEDTPEEYAWVHDRFPKLVSASYPHTGFQKQ